MNIQLPATSCTGCSACMNICSVGAISMVEQTDGFLYPQINDEKCIKCGQCMKACHALGFESFNKPLECYAAQVTDKDVLKVSTSGGLFYALADSIFSEGGAVYACNYDDDYNAFIQRFDAVEQIAPVHGSKYVWSDSSLSYPLVKKDLEEGRTVLYTGLPCQTAGLRKFLKKDHENLFTVDILCGGAPSPYAFQRYLETLTDKEGRKNLRFQFRDKEKNGSGVCCTYYINGVKHYENYLENSFYFAFCSKSRISWRKSCYDCNYKSLNRASDMTIGDYWGVEKHHGDFKPKDGVSLILVNTEQGKRLFEKIKGRVKYVMSDAIYAIEKNSLVKEPAEGHHKMPDNRQAFFEELRRSDWDTADRMYLSSRHKILKKQKLTRIPRKLMRMFKK